MSISSGAISSTPVSAEFVYVQQGLPAQNPQAGNINQLAVSTIIALRRQKETIAERLRAAESDL